VKKLLVVPLAALCAVPALAAATRKTPLVPTFVQHLVERKAGTLAYAPTRAPANYRYLSYTWNAAAKRLTIRLHDRHYAASNAKHTAVFTAAPFAGALSACSAGKQRTIQYAGNKVYWDGVVAWRCVRGTHGNVRLAATGAALPDVGLALVVSSAKRL
jgi:hypothetical protein